MVVWNHAKALHTNVNVRFRPLKDRCQSSESKRVFTKDLLYGVDALLAADSKPTRPQ